jgi:hypothetical protein
MVQADFDSLAVAAFLIMLYSLLGLFITWQYDQVPVQERTKAGDKAVSIICATAIAAFCIDAVVVGLSTSPNK